MLRQKSETQHQIPGISNLPFCYFHLYTHGLTYTKGGSRTLPPPPPPLLVLLLQVSREAKSAGQGRRERKTPSYSNSVSL